MKKISTFIAATAMTLSVAAPVLAEEANVNTDPFVSTQGNAGSLGLGASAATAAGIIAGVIFVAAIASSSSDGSASTTTTN